MFDPSAQTKVLADALYFGLGAVLLQRHGVEMATSGLCFMSDVSS